MGIEGITIMTMFFVGMVVCFYAGYNYGTTKSKLNYEKLKQAFKELEEDINSLNDDIDDIYLTSDKKFLSRNIQYKDD